LVYFEFEAFQVSEAVRLTDEPADFVVEALRTGVAGMSECPVAGDSFQSVSDGFCHSFQLRNKRFLSEFAPSVKCDVCLISVLNDSVDASQSFFEHICISKFLEIPPQIPQDVLCVFRDILVVFEEDEPQTFQLLLLNGIQSAHHSSPNMVEFVIHELDDVEVIEHDLSLREVFGKPGGVRICHIHCNYLQFTCIQLAQGTFQSRNAFAVADVDDRAALQIPYDREESPVRLTMSDMDFINADRFDFRCVNRRKFVLEIPLFDLFHSMPSKMKVVRQRPDADLFPELKDRPFELIAQAGFRMRNERNMLNGTLVAAMAVHLMQRVNEMNFPNPSHR
jgi:hypothetical protein